jgi:hypothetical protein
MFARANEAIERVRFAALHESASGTFEKSIDCPVYGRFREQCGHQPPIAGHSDL